MSNFLGKAKLRCYNNLQEKILIGEELKMRRFIYAFVILMVLFTSAGAGGMLATLVYHPETSSAQNPNEIDIVTEADDSKSILVESMGNPYLIADIAEKTSPAIVMIDVEWPEAERMPRDPFSWFFFPDWHFEPFAPHPTVTRGTGFLIDQKGHIFTNQHVVGDRGQDQKITVSLHPASGFETEVKAEIIGSDYELDLAILKLVEIPDNLEGKLPTLKLGDSDASRPGEWVIAIGNPYGYEHTVTLGVLSAKGREISVYDMEKQQPRHYLDLLQTDAAINQGNSGGPLLNIEGEVIGINTAVKADGQGIGFAIPINTAIEVMDELITEGKVIRPDPVVDFDWEPKVIPLTLGEYPQDPKHPFIGISYLDVTEEMATQLNLPEAKGIIILDVVYNSAADKAGFRVYDVITHFGDVKINDGEDLRRALGNLNPGDQVITTLLRYVRQK